MNACLKSFVFLLLLIAPRHLNASFFSNGIFSAPLNCLKILAEVNRSNKRSHQLSLRRDLLERQIQAYRDLQRISPYHQRRQAQFASLRMNAELEESQRGINLDIIQSLKDRLIQLNGQELYAHLTALEFDELSLILKRDLSLKLEIEAEIGAVKEELLNISNQIELSKIKIEELEIHLKRIEKDETDPFEIYLLNQERENLFNLQNQEADLKIRQKKIKEEFQAALETLNAWAKAHSDVQSWINDNINK
ncbi:MAG: hypothetical protein KA116_10115 [Proteobacteria bacterium]|nr:hypothetical protein [Pseudomonadota bacterium]